MPDITPDITKDGPGLKGRVANKKVFITGAGQGLGACFAHMLAAEGAMVTLSDLTLEAAQLQADEINAKYQTQGEAQRAHAVQLDVTQKEQWEKALSVADNAMGGISVLINNAGIGLAGTIESETLEGWRRAHNINLDSVFVGTQLALPYLKKTQPASIITISSIASMAADSFMMAYNSSKAGVAMMSKSVALHCAREKLDIRANTVHPVFIRTPIIEPILAMAGGGEVGEHKITRRIPLRRLGEPEDVGYAVLYLASDESRFVTGTEFKVDGGLTA